MKHVTLILLALGLVAMDLLTFESTISMVGVGMSGMVAGKQLKFEGGSAPYEWYLSGTARIH